MRASLSGDKLESLTYGFECDKFTVILVRFRMVQFNWGCPDVLGIAGDSDEPCR